MWARCRGDAGQHDLVHLGEEHGAVAVEQLGLGDRGEIQGRLRGDMGEIEGEIWHGAVAVEQLGLVRGLGLGSGLGSGSGQLASRLGFGPGSGLGLGQLGLLLAHHPPQPSGVEQRVRPRLDVARQAVAAAGQGQG